MSENKGCCCGPQSAPAVKYLRVPVLGRIATEIGEIDVVSAKWDLRDYLGALKVRLDIGRMDYAVAPGIYAVGDPGKESPVLVCANYKLSFDVLRKDLAGLDAWILVIDSKGVNVWCAAGKGTFGTSELTLRIMAAGLDKIVRHRQVIVPQLGAPGIRAHIVQKTCGFTVLYGPVRSADIKRYLKQGMQADPGMRRVRFGLIDRLTVAWLELAMAVKAAVIGTLLLAVVIALTANVPVLAVLKPEAQLLLFIFWAVILSGTILNAVLLPYLPGRAFSIKGGVLGMIVCAMIILVSRQHLPVLSWISFLLMSSGATAFLALNFTGASTYTSLSGVKKEIRYAMPFIKTMVFLGAAMVIAATIRRLL